MASILEALHGKTYLSSSDIEDGFRILIEDADW